MPEATALEWERPPELPAPDTAEALSTPAEIDAFVEAVRDTAPPAIESESAADYDMPALPPPGEEK